MDCTISQECGINDVLLRRLVSEEMPPNYITDLTSVQCALTEFGYISMDWTDTSLLRCSILKHVVTLGHLVVEGWQVSPENVLACAADHCVDREN
jgi:hypothetical protein